jgi:hypothetical protein
VNLILLLLIPIYILEIEIEWYSWLFISLVCVFIGSCELLVSTWQIITSGKFGKTSNLAFLVIPIVLYVASVHLLGNTKILYHESILAFNEYFLGIFMLNIDSSSNIITLLISVLIFTSVPANYIIRWLLSLKDDVMLSTRVILHIKEKENSKSAAIETAASLEHSDSVIKDNIRAGRVIGVLERWLVLVFVLMDQFTAIGFLLAAKSVARFREVKGETSFPEVSFIGTLYSIMIAILFGLLLTNYK